MYSGDLKSEISFMQLSNLKTVACCPLTPHTMEIKRKHRKRHPVQLLLRGLTQVLTYSQREQCFFKNQEWWSQTSQGFPLLFPGLVRDQFDTMVHHGSLCQASLFLPLSPTDPTSNDGEWLASFFEGAFKHFGWFSLRWTSQTVCFCVSVLYSDAVSELNQVYIS